MKDRKEALLIIKRLSSNVRDAIALVVETAEVQGDYHWSSEGSVYEDDVAATLNQLAREIRSKS